MQDVDRLLRVVPVRTYATGGMASATGCPDSRLKARFMRRSSCYRRKIAARWISSDGATLPGPLSAVVPVNVSLSPQRMQNNFHALRLRFPRVSIVPAAGSSAQLHVSDVSTKQRGEKERESARRHLSKNPLSAT